VIGFNRIDFLHIVFPNSKVNPFKNPEKIATVANAKFAAWGGMAQVDACYPPVKRTRRKKKRVA
jgi:hypothetical protein